MSDIIIKVGDDLYHFPLVEAFASCDFNSMIPEMKVVDLSSYVPACSVERMLWFRGK